MEELLQKIREIRTRQDMVLKPSPYLKSSYVDEYGDSRNIVIRNYQAQMIMNLLMMEKMINADDTGLGKAQPVDSKILTPTGWVLMGDLKIGDKVIGKNGRPTKVVGVFPQGIKQAFKVTMSDGSSTECCEDHLWTVRTGNTRRSGDGWRTFPLKTLVSKGLLRQRNSTGRRWSIPMVEPVEFKEQKLPVDPYLLGALLGDGSLHGSVRICNGDPDLFSLVSERIPPDVSLKPISRDKYSQGITGKAGVKNSLLEGLKKIGLLWKNWKTKFIPTIYLMGSVRQRIELLRGLMDTDGYISKDGNAIQFYSSNIILTEHMVQLVQSLGGTAKVKSKNPVLGKNSKAKKGRLAYTVTISLPNSVIPFSLPRKVSRWKNRTKYLPIRCIDKVEPSRKVECVCIRVSADDSLYVTDNFIITHNTIETLSAIGYVWMKEPEYVPIVVTTKSALFQWAGEIRKFMQSMEAVTVSGSPFKRHALYEDFFLNHDPNRKRLLILTYDHIMYDMDESVIREKVKAPRKGFAKEQSAAREERKAATVELEAAKDQFNSAFADRIFDVSQYVEECLREGPENLKIPFSWTSEDTTVLNRFISARDRLAAAVEVINGLNREAAPPKRVPGIANYINELKSQHPNVRLLLAMDEMHKLKNHKSQFHTKTAMIASQSQRLIGITATPVKNRLMEFFALFRIIQPGLFPKITHFQNDYCVTKLQSIGGGRQVPIVVGYKNLDGFVSKIEPFYLSRKKHDVAKELPTLISCEVECELHELQEELYDMAETGLLSKSDDPDSSNAELLQSMTMCQQSVNSPRLIADENGDPYDGPSSKIDELLELLEDDADEQKVIVFSRFEKMISVVDKVLQEKKIKFVRITGKENDPKYREKVKNQFQDVKSGINVILITTAGSESINLHSAQHFVFLDLPWSAGDYLQLIGRMVRIGSSHHTVTAHHFLARKRDGTKTIDHHVLKALRSKKKLMDKVAGDGLKGGLVFTSNEVSGRDILDEIRSNRGESVAKAPASAPVTAKKKAIAEAKKKEDEANPIVNLNVDFSDI